MGSRVLARLPIEMRIKEIKSFPFGSAQGQDDNT